MEQSVWAGRGWMFGATGKGLVRLFVGVLVLAICSMVLAHCRLMGSVH